MNDDSQRKRRRTMLTLYPDEEEVICLRLFLHRPTSSLLASLQPALCAIMQRDALDANYQPQDEPGADFMEVALPDSAEQYAPEEDDEDQMYMQQAPNDTLMALQLLRSQFPAKARVGTPSTGYLEAAFLCDYWTWPTSRDLVCLQLNKNDCCCNRRS